MARAVSARMPSVQGSAAQVEAAESGVMRKLLAVRSSAVAKSPETVWAEGAWAAVEEGERVLAAAAVATVFEGKRLASLAMVVGIVAGWHAAWPLPLSIALEWPSLLLCAALAQPSPVPLPVPFLLSGALAHRRPLLPLPPGPLAQMRLSLRQLLSSQRRGDVAHTPLRLQWPEEPAQSEHAALLPFPRELGCDLPPFSHPAVVPSILAVPAVALVRVQPLPAAASPAPRASREPPRLHCRGGWSAHRVAHLPCRSNFCVVRRASPREMARE